MDSIDEIKLGTALESILNNEYFVFLVNTINVRMFEIWRNEQNPQAREQIWTKLDSLAWLIAEMQAAVAQKDLKVAERDSPPQTEV